MKVIWSKKCVYVCYMQVRWTEVESNVRQTMRKKGVFSFIELKQNITEYFFIIILFQFDFLSGPMDDIYKTSFAGLVLFFQICMKRSKKKLPSTIWSQSYQSLFFFVFRFSLLTKKKNWLDWLLISN